MTESAEARLARLAEKIDGISELMEHRFDTIEDRLRERCSGHMGRIETLERSVVRFGERIGRLEAEREQQKGGKAVITALLAAGAAAGGLAVKLIQWGGAR